MTGTCSKQETRASASLGRRFRATPVSFPPKLCSSNYIDLQGVRPPFPFYSTRGTNADSDPMPHDSQVIQSSDLLCITSEIAFATTLDACTDGCSSSYLSRNPPRVTNTSSTRFGPTLTYQRKLSGSGASVHTPRSCWLSFSWNTHTCAAPVTLNGPVPFRYSCGRAYMSAKSECESNRPVAHTHGEIYPHALLWHIEYD